MNSSRAAEQRVQRLVAAAQRIADPRDPIGIEARVVLPGATGLSPEGVSLAIEQSLETSPSEAEISALCAGVEPAPRAHVLLSANVFVAAHRAVALALAASDTVFVRPSRREPEMVRLLALGAPRLFQIVEKLEPDPKDHVWAYGSSETLESFRDELPADVVFRAHGTGLGVVILDFSGARENLGREYARDVARDIILFDQRGCLSPRIVIVVGSEIAARHFGRALASELDVAERQVPRGRLSPDETQDAVRYRDTVRFAADLLPAGGGWVGIDVRGDKIVVPPAGRHVHVIRTVDPVQFLRPLHRMIAAISIGGSSDFWMETGAAFPGARQSRPGAMQRPPFDGPVDRRTSAVILSGTAT